MGDLHKAVGHYKGLAAGAKRMKDMGHKTASGGPPSPPKKGCRLFALALLAGGGASLTVMSIMIEITANRLL
jgi:hypothetical protein